MGWCKKDVTPFLKHWSYVFLAQTYQCLPCAHCNQDVALIYNDIQTRGSSVIYILTTLICWNYLELHGSWAVPINLSRDMVARYRLSVVQLQDITWTNVDLLSIASTGIHFNTILSETQLFSSKKMPLKMLSPMSAILSLSGYGRSCFTWYSVTFNLISNESAGLQRVGMETLSGVSRIWHESVSPASQHIDVSVVRNCGEDFGDDLQPFCYRYQLNQHRYMQWISNYTHIKQCGIVINPCPNCSGSLIKVLLKFELGQIITFHTKLWMDFLVHFLVSFDLF